MNRDMRAGIVGLIAGLVGAHMAGADLTNRYVVKNNAGAAEPYDSPANAAADIQTALHYARAGETVLVAAAVYDTGGLTNWPAGTVLTNRVVVTNGITLRSLDNDPATTIIRGAWDPATTNGPAAVRGVYLAANAALIGFTVTGGATLPDKVREMGSGGGVYGATTAAVLSNCIFTGNQAGYWGGGVYRGRVFDSTFSENRAGTSGGGAGESHLIRCTLVSNTCAENGGAAYVVTASNCTFTCNRARSGAVSFGGTFYNCLMAGNHASLQSGALLPGSGVSYTLHNCTIMGNYAWSGGGVSVDANRTVWIYNSIIYSNSAGSGNGPNILLGGGALYITNACTFPAVDGWAAGNMTNPPMVRDYGAGYGTNLVGGDFRLHPDSPCINAGLNLAWMTNAMDLDGAKRIYYDTVDIGAYELLHRGTLMSIR